MQESLTTELISDASLWRLALEVGRDTLQVVVMSMLHDGSLIHRAIPLDLSRGYLPALTRAVYDNPLILGDFGKIDILVDTERMALVPNDTNTDPLVQEMMSVLWPDGVYTVMADDIPHSDDTLLMGVDNTLLSFLRRTFPLARIMHRLTPIARYFYNKERLNNAPKMYAHLKPGAIDLVFLRNGQIATLNTFKTKTTDDALYYILAMAKSAGFSQQDDVLMICGDKEQRDALMAELPKYIVHVMPVLFPSSMINMGADAQKAPFSLIILPLCE